MKSIAVAFSVVFLAGGSWMAQARLSPDQVAQLPPPAARPVQFAADIKPLLEDRCIKCHGRGKAKGGFSLQTRSSLLQGGDSGPAVHEGNSASSYLIELVSGLNPDDVMPRKGSKLSAGQVGLLRAWIDQGLPWDAAFTFAKLPPVNLTPRHPELPPAQAGVEHPVDRLLRPYFERTGFQPPPVVGDRVFARRVYLDVIGLLPNPEALEQFVADPRPNKRERLVDRLLADNRRYAEHWLSFWNDALRNDYRGTGYIDGGRKQISAWLASALANNMPYDQFVRELVNPTPASEGFVKGIVWRGVVNASQTPQLQAAQNISQLFMGINLKCASCHDSFINDWTLADAYGLAAVYADGPLEMFRCDKPTGKKVTARFLYPELGTIPVEAPRAERQRRLAEILTSPRNGRLSRTMVNRLWQRLLGVGLVEPLDDMEQPSWHPDLLDWLAEDLVAHKYDLKHTLKRILTSRAYQLPAVSVDEGKHTDFVFTGPAVRRLTAEQFRDAVGTVTGVWYRKPAVKLDFTADDTARQPRATLMPRKAKWIWSEAAAQSRALPETLYFWKRFALDQLPEKAWLAATCDNSFTLYVNGARVVAGKDWQQPRFADIARYLKAGANLIAVAATNHRPNNQPPSPDQPPAAAEANPAGLIVYARIRRESAVLDVVTDDTWVWSRQEIRGWEQAGGIAQAARPAAVLGGVEAAPWQINHKLASALSLAAIHGPVQVRTSLVPADPLTTALGRPPREQMLTRRQSAATTLQALELTNGKTFSDLLQAGAKQLLADHAIPTGELVRTLYARALGRPPAASELALARQLVGQPARPDQVEDFLWALTMLPEFQLIY